MVLFHKYTDSLYTSHSHVVQGPFLPRQRIIHFSPSVMNIYLKFISFATNNPSPRVQCVYDTIKYPS